ncbi:DUF3017 domain-containing protein [Streptomyces sp. NPDC012623]|uniref:DUF3017 domain-containing protein n=1 Tax=unclassified Streptomyces TaxID=2593676 RepID=UPI0036CF577A
MGAGTSAAGTGADGAARSRRASVPGTAAGAAATGSEGTPEAAGTAVAPAERAPEAAARSASEAAPRSASEAAGASESESAGEAGPAGEAETAPSGEAADSGASGASEAPGTPADSADSSDSAESADSATVGGDAPDQPEPGSRFSLTQDTARPEGGGRAAPRDAPAPARQWPLLSVLGTIGLGLLIVGLHPFAEAFRIGTILIGLALIGGAALRRVMPSVGMLAVRSRFTDMLTYGLLGVAIVMLSLMTQPGPWLEIPFLEDIVHSTVP